MPTSSVPVRALRTASSMTVVFPVSVVVGSAGTAVTGAVVKLRAPVKSPVAPRRQEVVGVSPFAISSIPVIVAQAGARGHRGGHRVQQSRLVVGDTVSERACQGLAGSLRDGNLRWNMLTDYVDAHWEPGEVGSRAPARDA
jgi:hypothetical protein